MPDRPYQAEMKGAIGSNYDQGIRQQLINAATGVGKTYVFAGLPEYLKSRLPGRSLILAHREELIDQSIEHFRQINPTLSITKEMAGNIGDVNADIIVGSIATLGRKGSKRADKFPWTSIDKVTTDEAHHAITDTYLNVYERAGVLRPDTHKIHIGFTATTQRADGVGLAKVFRKVVYEYSLRRAIEEGYLVEPKGIRVRTTTSLEEVKTSGGDYQTNSLAEAVDTPERNQTVVKAWLEYGEERSTIAFTSNILHARHLAEIFQYYGVKAEAVWGDDPDRAEKIERHKAGVTTVILNCGVLTEGYDDPKVSCILLARPTKSGVLYCQMIGRGTRLFPGKEDLIVIDIVDASINNSLLTLPTLMGLPTTLDTKGKGLLYSVKKIEEAAKEYPHIDFTKLVDIDSLGMYIQDTNLFDVVFPKEVEEGSLLSWMPNPTGGYVLLLPEKERITIKQNLLGKFEIAAVIKGQKYKGERDTLSESFSAADNLIRDKALEAVNILSRDAYWHEDPATKPQLNLLKKLAKGKAIPADLDKGRADKLIKQFLANKA